MQLIISPQESHHYFIYVVKDASNVILFANYDKLPNIVALKQLLPNPQFDATQTYIVELHTSHEHFYDAVNSLNRLIRQLCGDVMPAFNLSQHFNRNNNVQCLETGVVYRNASDACRALNIQPPRMSNHLKNRTGHKTIKGLTFKYI